jgi:hypothetical protein
MEILDSGGCIDVAYCDFMKAFDKVPHHRLLHKLKLYGIGENYRNWIKSFLLNRRQKVTVNGESSDWRNVTSGIPQGSVLGPVLFVLYINDLPASLQHNSEPYLYADDTKIFKGIFKDSDCEELQQDIHEMYNWSEKWMLKFHPDKCKTMRIGRSNIDQYSYSLKPGHKPMDNSNAEKDVGVTIDNKLTFEKHITEKVNKANSILGVIRRTFEYLDLQTFRLLYVSLVRPHLEYANSVWNPFMKKHIDMIENVQRRATKLIPGLSELTYEERLRKLKLPSLSYRRSRGDMIEVYKIVTNKYDPEVSNILHIQNQSQRTTRGHQYKLVKYRCRLNIRKHSFCHRVINMWNELPESVVTAKNLLTFEKRLDRHWINQEQLFNYREPITTGPDNIKSDEEELELVPQAIDSLLPEPDL